MRVQEEERRRRDIHDKFCKGHRREVMMADWVSEERKQLMKF